MRHPQYTDNPVLQCTTPGCSRKRAAQKGYYLRLCWKCRNLLKKERHPLRYQFNILRKSAKRRGIPFQITFEEWCQWCEQTGYMEVKGKQAGSKSVGRIDHSQGYSLENIQIEDYQHNCNKGHTIPGQEVPQNYHQNPDPF